MSQAAKRGILTKDQRVNSPERDTIRFRVVAVSEHIGTPMTFAYRTARRLLRILWQPKTHRKEKEMELVDLVPPVLLFCSLAGFSFYAITRNRRWFISGGILAALTVLLQVVVGLL